MAKSPEPHSPGNSPGSWRRAQPSACCLHLPSRCSCAPNGRRGRGRDRNRKCKKARLGPAACHRGSESGLLVSPIASRNGLSATELRELEATERPLRVAAVDGHLLTTLEQLDLLGRQCERQLGATARMGSGKRDE